jgi:hypothetical protein
MLFIVSGVVSPALTCERLVLGEPHVGSYPQQLPLCIQLNELEGTGVSLKMSVQPPTASLCVEVEMLTQPRSLQQEKRCLSPADQGTMTLPLLPPSKPHTYVVSYLRASRGVAAAAISTEISLDESAPPVPTPTPPPGKPSANGHPTTEATCHTPAHTSTACATKEARLKELCATDAARMRRAYDKCRASNCTAATVGCLQAHMSELGSDCAAAVEEMAGCCPEPAVAHRCPGAESRALAACANDTAALQAAWPQECWTLNCTATAVGCLLAHKSELRLTCQGAVSEVQQCCARPEEESKCSAQEEEVLMVCQDDMRALQTLLPQECWNTNCEVDAINCLRSHKDHLAFPKCVDAVSSIDACMNGAWDLLGPMVIAAYLLLATASVVLLCTMLRCCCRCVCSTPLASQGDGGTQSEDEAGLEDDEFSVLPLPSGVKQKESQEEEDENALPGYSDVVEGASLPMQTTAS